MRQKSQKRGVFGWEMGFYKQGLSVIKCYKNVLLCFLQILMEICKNIYSFWFVILVPGVQKSKKTWGLRVTNLLSLIKNSENLNVSMTGSLGDRASFKGIFMLLSELNMGVLKSLMHTPGAYLQIWEYPPANCSFSWWHLNCLLAFWTGRVWSI